MTQNYRGNPRFGFLKIGKPYTCKHCSAQHAQGEPRLYDNTDKIGPICLPCVNRLDAQAQPTVNNQPTTASLDLSSSEALDRIANALEALTNAATLTGKPPETNETVDPLSPPAIDPQAFQDLANRVAKIEAYLQECHTKDWSRIKHRKAPSLLTAPSDPFALD